MKILKRGLSFVLSLMVMLSAFSIPAAAAIDEEALMTQFVDSVFELNNKKEFLDAFELFQTVNDPIGLANAYENAFNALGGSQQDKMIAFGVTVPLIKELATRANTTIVTVDDLDEWFKTDDKASFRAFAESIKTVIYSIGDSEEISKSFHKMDEVFTLLRLQTIAKIAIFETPQAFGDLVVLEEGIDTVVEAAGLVNLVVIENIEPLYAAMGELVKYYNATSDNDRRSIFQYLNKYNFVKIVGNGGSTGGGNGGGTGGGTPGNNDIEEIIDDEATPEGAPGFTDLEGYEWAMEAINALAAVGVINGRSEGIYAPKESVTRAEFSSIISRMLSLKGDVSQLKFNDVKSTDWFAADVAAVFEAKIVEGKSTEIFAPQDKITREEMAAMISRVLIYFGNETDLTDDEANIELAKLADGNSVSVWAKKAMALVIKKGIIQGVVLDGVTKAFPKKNATRAECAVMSYRLAEFVESIVEIK